MVIDGTIETLAKGTFKDGRVRNVYPVTIDDAIYVKNSKGEYIPFTQYIVTQDNIGGIVDELLVKYNIISTATTTTTTTEEPVLNDGFYVDGTPNKIDLPVAPASKVIYVYTVVNHAQKAITAVPQDGKLTAAITSYNPVTGYAAILLTGLFTGMSNLEITQTDTGSKIILPIRVYNPSSTTTTTTSSEEPQVGEVTSEATASPEPEGNSLSEVLDEYVNN